MVDKTYNKVYIIRASLRVNKMGKKGLVTIEVLSIIFVPGMLTLFLITKLGKLIKKFSPKKTEA